MTGFAMEVAMSKDIRRYFEFDDSTCIITDENTILTEVQARRSTACFSKHKHFHRVVFTPYARSLHLFQLKQKQVYHFGYDFTLEELNITAASLVDEVRLFLLRGHSVRDKTCTCNPHLPYARFLDYGLSLQHNGHTALLDSSAASSVCEPCPLDALSQVRFTCEQIAAELGLSSLQAVLLRYAQPATIHDILAQSGEFMSLENGGMRTWELCGKHVVDDEKSLLEFVKRHRLGVAMHHKRIEYPLLHVHVRRLVQKGLLIHLHAQGMLYSVPGLHGQQKCDDDIVALWRGGQQPSTKPPPPTKRRRG